MKTITKIEANRSAAVHRKCRVAAYCRVSTEHDDQIESLGTQKEHYAAWIKLHTEWESAGIFYDAGITGTKAEIRPGLQDLLQACRMGRVDRILVKSISRFSRNTAECLALVRELSGIGVSVFFEKENIWTFDSKGELLITIMSSLAQEESRSISENLKWGIRKRFEAGENGLLMEKLVCPMLTFWAIEKAKAVCRRLFRRRRKSFDTFISDSLMV